MPAQLNAAWWKKNKAKTLISEPLTKALESMDKAYAALQTKPTRENMAALGGQIKLVQGAIPQTIAKCNSTLHKSTIASLKELEAQAKAAYGILQTSQADFAKTLADFHKLRDAVGTMLDKAAATPDEQNVGAALGTVRVVLKWVNANVGNQSVSSDETVETSQWMVKTELALGEMLKAIKMPDDAKKTAQMKGLVGELKAVIPKVKALGGYFKHPKVTHAAHNVLG